MINEKIVASSDDASYTFGTSVNIASRTSSTNTYTCPSDGYVKWTANSAITAYFNGGGMLANVENKYASLYAKKGLRVYFSAAPSTGLFLPLVKSSS